MGSPVSERPPLTAGPGATQGDWREVVLTVRVSDIRRVRRAASTLGVEVQDCQTGDHLRWAELYVAGVSLNSVKGMRKPAFDATFQDLPRETSAIAYLDARDLKGRSEVCLQVRGGSMLGQHVVARRWKLATGEAG